MNSLKYIRAFYKVKAYRGGRIKFEGDGVICGTIKGGRHAKLRVRFDGAKRTELLHPTWRVTYL